MAKLRDIWVMPLRGGLHQVLLLYVIVELSQLPACRAWADFVLGDPRRCPCLEKREVLMVTVCLVWHLGTSGLDDP